MEKRKWETQHTLLCEDRGAVSRCKPLFHFPFSIFLFCRIAAAIACGAALCPATGSAQEGPSASAVKQWDVVREKSTFEVRLGKSGWLRIFGDEHFIDVTGYEFKIAFDPAAPAQGSSVEIMIPSRGLRVRDPHLSAETRLEVQAKMEGPEVLDLANFREIRFKSKRVTAGDPSLYRVDGDLTIRASSRPMAFDLTLEREGDGYRARGIAPVKMTAFGIEPPSAGGGGIKVRDEMKIVFDLLLIPQT